MPENLQINTTVNLWTKSLAALNNYHEASELCLKEPQTLSAGSAAFCLWGGGGGGRGNSFTPSIICRKRVWWTDDGQLIFSQSASSSLRFISCGIHVDHCCSLPTLLWEENEPPIVSPPDPLSVDEGVATLGKTSWHSALGTADLTCSQVNLLLAGPLLQGLASDSVYLRWESRGNLTFQSQFPTVPKPWIIFHSDDLDSTHRFFFNLYKLWATSSP